MEEKPLIPYIIITGFTFVNYFILCWLDFIFKSLRPSDAYMHQ